MECSPKLDELDKELDSLYLWWSTTNEDEQSAAVGVEPENTTLLNVGR